MAHDNSRALESVLLLYYADMRDIWVLSLQFVYVVLTVTFHFTAWVHKKTRGKAFSWCYSIRGKEYLITFACSYLINFTVFSVYVHVKLMA